MHAFLYLVRDLRAFDKQLLNHLKGAVNKLMEQISLMPG